MSSVNDAKSSEQKKFLFFFLRVLEFLLTNRKNCSSTWTRKRGQRN